MMNMKPLDWACLGLAVFAAYFCAFVELHTTEIWAVLGVLLLTGVLLGFARPKRFWLWAMVTGVSIPLSHPIAGALGIAQREPQTSVLSLLAVGAVATVAAMLSAGVGAVIARVAAE